MDERETASQSASQGCVEGDGLRNTHVGGVDGIVNQCEPGASTVYWLILLFPLIYLIIFIHLYNVGFLLEFVR